MPPSLLDRAQASPDASFDVIVTGGKNRSASDVVNAVQGDSGGKGKLKRTFLSVNGASVTLSGKDLLKLAKNPNVQSIVPDRKLGLLDYQSAEMWRRSTGVDSLWSKPAVTCATNALGLKLDPTCLASPAVTAPQAPAIAILDSGIDPTRVADFGTRIRARADMVGDGAAGDPVGHGTMVAGIAAGASAAYPGVAQNAPLVDVRVAGATGQALTSDIIAGIDWILRNKDQYGIRVVNISLGGTSATSFAFDPIDKAVERLWLAGVVVVASAGNAGAPDHPVDIGSPANDPFIITVGALDTRGTADPADDTRVGFSSYGVTADGFVKPELTAPGRYMVAPVPTTAALATTAPDRLVAPGYMWMSGTSFSAPIVAGAAAQLLARNPGLSPNAVKGALMASATRLPGQSGAGFGEVNAAAAAAVANPPNPNEHLYDFVAADAGGTVSFDANAWHQAVLTQSNWVESNWVESNWVESNWVESNWVESNWVESNWVESNWVESNWVESNWVE